MEHKSLENDTICSACTGFGYLTNMGIVVLDNGGNLITCEYCDGTGEICKTQQSLDDTTELIDNMKIKIHGLQQQLAEMTYARDRSNVWWSSMSEIADKYWENLVNMKVELTEMTEARDAVAAGAKWLRDKCSAQECTLNMIAAYGEDNPNWAARIAWAMVDDEVEQRR